MMWLTPWILIILVSSLHIYMSHAFIRNKRAVVWKSAKRWDNGIIPYYIDRDAFNEEEMLSIQDAIIAWNMETCIQFRLRLSGDRNWVKITNGSSCHSSVGMAKAGEQELNLATPECRYYGTYLHELGHVIGLHHEHVRPGRDKHLHINHDYIKKGYKKLYEQINKSDIIHFGTDYDLQSIMHYGSQSFVGTDDRTIIDVKNKANVHLLDEVYSKDLSFLDAKVVNLYYKCANRCRKRIVSCDKYGYIDQYCQCHTPSSFEDRRCADKIEEQWCKKKQKEGLCDIKSAYMSVNCRKTCDKCYKYKNRFLKKPKECKNFEKDSKCEAWSKRGECNKNPGYMKIHCKKSCNICSQDQPKGGTKKVYQNIYPDGLCNELAAMGECTKNKLLMKDHCEKSCVHCIFKTNNKSCIDSVTRWKEKAPRKNQISIRRCEVLKFAGYCKRLPEVMSIHCPEVCQTYKLGSRGRNVMTICRNTENDRKCDIMKNHGECKKNPSHMTIRCAKSCNFCVVNKTGCRNLETDEDCETWSRSGRCNTNPHFMMVHCAKACSRCTIKDYVECKDLYSKEVCKTLKRYGKCYEYPSMMLHYCAQSCGSCDLKEKNISNFICTNKIEEKFCNMWKVEGECGRNRPFMMENCGKTCGTCQSINKTLSFREICQNILSDKVCMEYKNNGFCKMDESFMEEKCYKTCKSCKIERRNSIPLKKCQNTYNDIICEKWKAKGECIRNHHLMQTVCGRTCTNCTGNGETIKCNNLKSDKECDKWAKQGKCLKNHAYMLRLCAKSCKNCSMYLQPNYVGEICRNIYDNETCDIWSQSGECMKNPKYMLVHCAKSCGNCRRNISLIVSQCQNKHDDKACDIWSRKGECTKNPEYMLVNCARSCNSCSYTTQLKKRPFLISRVPPTTVRRNYSTRCENLYQNDLCEKWKKAGDCKRNRIFMYSQCRKSCGKCGKFLECQNVYQNTACENWAREGKCVTNVKFMVTLCMKSCGQCSLLEFKIDKKNKMIAKSCRNKYGEISCEIWKSIGECTRNSIFMADQCTRSCGYCTDNSTSPTKLFPKQTGQCKNLYNDKICDEFSENNHCETDSTFLSTVCGKSCGSCGKFNLTLKASKRCLNLRGDKQCEVWKKFGDCEKNPIVMTEKCALACDKCKKNPLTKKETGNSQCLNVAGDIQCSYWARQNHCNRNPSYMRIYCQKSCNKCRIVDRKTLVCKNDYPTIQCQMWTRRGECDRNQIWMSENCAKSCLVCQLTRFSNNLKKDKQSEKNVFKKT